MGAISTELTQIMMESLPPALDDAVSELSPLWSQGERPAQWRGLPTIRRVSASSPAGPTRFVRLAGNESGGSYDPDGDAPTPGAAIDRQFQQGWGFYAGNLRINEKEMQQILSGMLKLSNYLEGQRSECAASIGRGLNTHAMSGNADHELDGMFTRAISDSVTYGGISRSTYENFQCKDYDNSGTPRNISYDIVRAALDDYEADVEPLPGQWIWIVDSYQKARIQAFTDGVASRFVTDNRMVIGATGIELVGYPVFCLPGVVAGGIGCVRCESLVWEYLNSMDPANPFIVKEPQESGFQTEFITALIAQLTLENPRKSAFKITDLNN